MAQNDNDYDRISELHEPLKLHILSFLKIEEIVATSLLSKKWRFLWRQTTCLNFSSNAKSSAKFIDRAIILHESCRVERFRLTIYPTNGNNTMAMAMGRATPLQLDSWVNFALRRGVKHLDLDLECPERHFTCFQTKSAVCYALPRLSWHCKSLEFLRLRLCRIDLPAASFCLPSLTTLELHYIYISDADVNSLISNCPVLQNLTLVHCNQSDDLNIRAAADSSLKILRLSQCFHDCKYGDKVKILAPTLLSIEFFGDAASVLLLDNSPSTLTVKFALHWYGEQLEYRADLKKYIVLFLDALVQTRHAQNVQFCICSVQILTILELEGLSPPSFGASNLILRAGFHKWNLPGIAYTIRSFDKLEFLRIYTRKESKALAYVHLEDDYAFNEEDFWISHETSSSKLLRNLKRVEIWHDEWLDCPESEEAAKMVGLAKSRDREMDFIVFLIKNASVLEKLTVFLRSHEKFQSEEADFVSKKFSRLKDVPRCSPSLEIILKKS